MILISPLCQCRDVKGTAALEFFRGDQAYEGRGDVGQYEEVIALHVRSHEEAAVEISGKPYMALHAGSVWMCESSPKLTRSVPLLFDSGFSSLSSGTCILSPTASGLAM